MKLFELLARIRLAPRGAAPPKGRDILLDFLKGTAITLVVCGHYLQGSTEKFDDLYGFRVIYSFHMPFFAFLSGAAAAHWIARLNTVGDFRSLRRQSFARVKSSINRLLIPFGAWTMVRFAVSQSQDSFYVYMTRVFVHVDNSLWFLPCMFWLTLYTVMLLFMLHAIRLKFAYLYISRHLTYVPLQALVLCLAWFLVRKKMPTQFGLDFANEIGRGLYIFFLFGVAFYGGIKDVKNIFLRVGPYFVWLLLVPYWHRAMPNNIATDAPGFLVSSGWINENFTLIVALSGTLALVDLSKLLVNSRIKWLDILFCTMGVESLVIYAAHYYFLPYSPPVISAIIVSMLIYRGLYMMPVTRRLFLGE